MAEFPVTKPQLIVPSCVNLSTYIQGMSDYEVRCYYTQLVQQWASEWAQMQTEWGTQQEAFESFKTYVNGQIAKFQSWFDNLNVQNEINNKIDEMANNGELLEIIQGTVVSSTNSAVDRWLEENMTPGAGAPALDSSFTLDNAAAQSKAVGDKFNQTLTYRRYLKEPSEENPIDFNTITDFGIYPFYFTKEQHDNGYVTNEPFYGASGIMLVAKYAPYNYAYQFAFSVSRSVTGKPYNDTIAFRIFTPPDQYTNWIYMPNMDMIESIKTEVQNKFNQTLTYRRFLNEPSEENPIDFNTITDFGIYPFYFTKEQHDNGYVTNEPFYGASGIMLVAKYAPYNYAYQFAFSVSRSVTGKPYNDTIAFRIFTPPDQYTNWIYMPNMDTIESIKTEVEELRNSVMSEIPFNPGVSMFDTVAVIGDSLSVGYYQKASGQQVRPVYTQSWPQYLVKKYGIKVFWCGFSGATTLTFLSSNDTTSAPYKTRGMNYVKEIGAKALYIVQLGVNDTVRGVPLGTVSDVGTNNDTFYGALSRIVTNVHTLAPDAFILVATPIVNINDDYEAAIEYVANYYNYCGFVDFRPYISRVSSLVYAAHYTELGYGYVGAIMDMLCGNTLNNTKFLRVNEANDSATDTDVNPYE